MNQILETLGIHENNSGVSYGEWIKKPSGGVITSLNPTSGKEIAKVMTAGPDDYELVMKKAQESFLKWRMIPAPQRGEIVREIGNELRRHKEDLGKLVSLEMGKILMEGVGEVQEMIDMADFAVGLSRQLYGLTMHSERPYHRMYEHWHPLGIVGIVSAFNFPVAVWSWNAMIAAVCGDTMVWKPSSLTPLTAIAVQNIADRVLQKHQLLGVMNLIVGKSSVIGDRFLADRRVPLISATGSCKMGTRVATLVGERFGRCILELGGNNGVVVMKDANLDLVLRAVLFGAVGTAGQRCTTIRRLLLQNEIADEMIKRLTNSYRQIKIGDPLQPGVLMGPLVSAEAVDDMMKAMEIIREQGGKVLYGGHRLTKEYPGGFFVEPTIVEAHPEMAIVKEETFAPILYVTRFATLEQAIELHNGVPQGLSSSIFTNDLIAAETFLSAMGSDCGIANVNIGTSGAEIGGAFGGEKDTGGGREAGSDSWKAYMRRQTTTINWGKDLPLAQGIKFGVE